MLFDPFTVIAQIVNFVILVVALKHFLYDRVIEAMDAREAAIAERLHDAEEREAVARREADELGAERARLAQDRHALLDQARTEAVEHQRELLDRARHEVDEERQRWERGLRAEQHELRRELQQQIAREVLALSRRALTDLAGSDLEATAIDRALDLLASEGSARRSIFGEGDQPPLVVRTAFVVPHHDRGAIVERMRELGLPAPRRVRFEDDPELVFGVELRGDGTAVSWNAADYLERLSAGLDELVEQAARDGHDEGSGSDAV